ncbi:MAG: hypothetical protein ACYC9J_00445 [Sulfuricaulis sp.]
MRSILSYADGLVTVIIKVVAGLLVVILVVAGISTISEPRKPTTPDIDQLSIFDKQLNTEEKNFNDQYTENNTRIQASIQSGDTFALYNAASQLHDIAYAEWKRINLDNAITVPDLSSTEANQQVHHVMEDWNNNVSSIQVMAENIMKAANGDLTPETAHNIQAALQYSNQLAADAAIALTKAYGALGYDLPQVDVEHGGLIAGAQHSQGEVQ